MPTPLKRYQEAIASGQFLPDAHQAQIVAHLQDLYHALHKSFRLKPLQGIYLWGSVGAGKTWLMDLFYNSISLKQKRRVHFHDFMREIHEQLQQAQGTKNPLEKIAKYYAKKIKLLCFDEFFVSDITDAMLLGNLFKALFRYKVVIVATSNLPPDKLYPNGLQRDRFLPAIALIQQHMDIFELKANQDYRRRALASAGLFFYPANPSAILKLFFQLAEGEVCEHQTVMINYRAISTIAYADNIVWLDFKALCVVPRSKLDYLAMAKRWSFFIIDNFAVISEKETNTARYFIDLIDILYDLKIILIINSDVVISDIYPGGELLFEFHRTHSRLIEMQSHAYFNQAAARGLFNY